MILLEIKSTPMWTDIVQAIGILIGVPITFWGIIKLFLHDKKREAEVNSLVDIAKSQNQVIIEMQNQLKEFSKQTQEMEYQSTLMNDSNELLKQQINLQTQVIMSDASHKENLIKYEIAKRKSDNKPYFIFAFGKDGRKSGDEFYVEFENIGKTAYFKKVIDQNTNLSFDLLIIPEENKMIEHKQGFRIGGRIKELNKNIDNNKFTFEFTDIDGVKYQQTFNRNSYIMGKPLEIVTI